MFNIINFEVENEGLTDQFTIIFLSYIIANWFLPLQLLWYPTKCRFDLRSQTFGGQGNVSNEKILYIILEINKLNKATAFSMWLQLGGALEHWKLVENAFHFLASGIDYEKDEMPTLDQSPLLTPNSKPFNKKLDILFHAININTYELRKTIN